MTRIRRLEIRNFRSIQTLDWTPSNGVNCLIGPGDSGKSTILFFLHTRSALEQLANLVPVGVTQVTIRQR
ncbi:AAA family ATPase [Laribacter hongkongensis]|uniref:AAA family ATPase n=1 Tax=Laribacter hongkongensis TaxID=168471 RepID=UPI002820B901|nr:AAA family ATPase [Laribacter hongkongensis]